MSITSFFQKLGAPLKNQRWSWGSVRKRDGAVFLRVWQDRKYVESRVPVMMLTHHAKYADKSDNPGWQERLEHIELIRSGAPCYLVMCLAEDPDSSPRKIRSFNEKDVFLGGELVSRDGDTWITIERRLPVKEVLL